MKKRFRITVGTVVASAVIAIVTAAPALAWGWSPPTGPVECLGRTSATFSGDTVAMNLRDATVSWSVSRPCSDITIRFEGDAVPTSGERDVAPNRTKTYTLTAHMDGYQRVIGRRTVVSAKAYGYYRSRFSGWTKVIGWSSTGGPEAEKLTDRMLSTLPESARANLVGVSLETHVIPATATLPELPAFSHLEGTSTCDDKPDTCVDDWPWSQVRGAGSVALDGGRIATAVGIEEIKSTSDRSSGYPTGYLFTHEMGHTVLDYAVPHEKANVAAELEQRGPNADYLGRDSYTSSSEHEYFAEGTAAFFGTPYAWDFLDEYNEQWLKDNDFPLWRILHRVYASK